MYYPFLNVFSFFHKIYRYLVFKVQYGHVLPNGGDNEIRTHDPLLARQVLSQLSYTPICFSVALIGSGKLNSVV